MKNILSLFLSLCLILGLAACGQAPQTPDARAIGSAVSALLSTAQTASEPAESLSSESPSAESSSTDSKPTAGTPSTPSAPVSSAASASASGPSSVTVPASSAMSVASSASVPESKPAIPEWEKAYELPTAAPDNSYLFYPMEKWESALLNPDPEEEYISFVGNIRHVMRESLTRQRIDSVYTVIPRLQNSEYHADGVLVYSDCVNYSFRTSEDLPEDQQKLLSITVRPLTEDMEKQKLEDLFLPQYQEKTTGEYNGIRYCAVDNGKDPDGYLTFAYYVKDGYLVLFQAFWSIRLEPWDNAYFDYFTFEKVAF